MTEELVLQISANRMGEKRPRYVLHADWSREQVFRQAQMWNDSEADWGIIGFMTRDGNAALLLPSDTYLSNADQSEEFSVFRRFSVNLNRPGLYIQARTADVEAIKW